MKRIAFYGSSLRSSYWNGAATYYRGLLKALAARGYAITFHEPDILDRGRHVDYPDPDWCMIDVYPGTPDGLVQAAAKAAAADIVVVASGVGYGDDRLLGAVMAAARPGALRLYWDVDAPATLATLQKAPGHPLRRALPDLDLVLTYGGGAPVVEAYRTLGARDCVPVYNALDPGTHHPVAPDARFAGDLAFLGNRLPDREARVNEFFFRPARALPGATFLLGGAGWTGGPYAQNIRHLGHVPATDHNALNATPRLVLNVCRASMAATGFSPPTRVFEAAGAGACLVTDAWTGVEEFLAPGREILVARDGADVAEIVAGTTPEAAAGIGARALRRVLADHTYAQRAETVDRLFRAQFAEAAT
jgi:spore maturation protein CgeB